MSMKGIAKKTAVLIALIIIVAASIGGAAYYYSTLPTATSAPTPKPTATPAAAPEFVKENKVVYESGATYEWMDPHVSYYQYDYWILWHTVETLLWYNRESATDRCKKEEPQMIERESDHWVACHYEIDFKGGRVT